MTNDLRPRKFEFERESSALSDFQNPKFRRREFVIPGGDEIHSFRSEVSVWNSCGLSCPSIID
jgi:hypothetical protein